jgi:small subunit ribosomal protein S17
MTAVKTQKNKAQPIRKGRTLSGVVVSDKMKDTIVVMVSRYTKHPKYEKFIQTRKKYKAHDAGNTAKIGETVSIYECKPISKDKRFTLIAKVK